jgi:adenine-specific DNA-methyltransferase
MNDSKRAIESYDHRDKQRVNNPPVGLVNPDTDPYAGVKKGYAYDPHLDPQLQWAGKVEHTAFEVPTVSLHVHERPWWPLAVGPVNLPVTRLFVEEIILECRKKQITRVDILGFYSFQEKFFGVILHMLVLSHHKSRRGA